MLSVDGVHWSTRFVPTSTASLAAMRLMVLPLGAAVASSSIRVSEVRGARILLNVFDGGPRTLVHVEYPVRPDPVRPLTRLPERDPFAREFFSRNRSTCKPWADASMSSHLWSGSLPGELEAGVHRVTARVRDEYGREHSQDSLIEVIG